MIDALAPADLVAHLVRTRGLEPAQARRLVEEVAGYYADTVEGFVARRHRELQGEGLANAAIYARIEAELGGHRFRAPALSQRQIRRIVYG